MNLSRHVAPVARMVVIAAILSLSACKGRSPVRNVQADLSFTQHNFGAYCFDVSECNVSYDGHYVVRNGFAERSPKLPDASTLNALSASYLAIPNFPEPVSITWRSKNGCHHDAEIDIARIFRSNVARHNADAGAIATDGYIGDPDIVMVVNDRTIKVYMKAFITLKSDAPARNVPPGRFELVEVFSQVFDPTKDPRLRVRRMVRPGVELTTREKDDLATVRTAIDRMGILDVVDHSGPERRLFVANFGGIGRVGDNDATHIDAVVLQNELSVLRSTRQTMASAYVRHQSFFATGFTGYRRVGSMLGEDASAKMTLQYMNEAWRWRHETPDARILRQTVAVDDGEGFDAADQMSIGLYDAEWIRTEMRMPGTPGGSLATPE